LGIKIDAEKCTRCAVCVSACPFGALEIKDDKIMVGEACNLCGACRKECPAEAILIEEARAQAADGEYRGVWVFAEQREGRLKSVAFELLAKGRELADSLQTELSAIAAATPFKQSSS